MRARVDRVLWVISASFNDFGGVWMLFWWWAGRMYARRAAGERPLPVPG